MRANLLDMPQQTWVESDHHVLLIIIASISVLALVGIFIYRRKKGK